MQGEQIHQSNTVVDTREGRRTTTKEDRLVRLRGWRRTRSPWIAS